METKKKFKLSPWWIVGGMVVVLIAIFVGMYNGMAQQNQDVEASWSQVENQMQRRYDLVPNLVNSVKGSMKQEQKIFDAIADARKAYGSASTDKEKMEANGNLDQSVGTLVNVIQENYPELTSNKNVQMLMTQLEGTENRISTERRRYNLSVKSYNRAVVTFPKNIFANMMGLGKKPYFEAVAGAENAPTVDFGD